MQTSLTDRSENPTARSPTGPQAEAGPPTERDNACFSALGANSFKVVCHPPTALTKPLEI